MLRFLRGGGKRIKAMWWVLTLVIIFTFIGSFIFLFGSGLGSGPSATAGGAVATVDGKAISRTEYQNAVTNQQQAFAARYGNQPGDQERQTIETQAFRALVLNAVLNRKAKELGLEAHDREVLLQLQTNPPQALMAAPAFQTNGQFDPQKYSAAMRDPNNNWSAFEQEIRDNLPVRKLQERMFTSIKLTEGELREEWRNRQDRLSITAAVLMPDRSQQHQVKPADLDRVYEKYKSRFVSGAQRQLEVLLVPKSYGNVATKAASDLATSLVQRIRRGESFEGLSREYSDAPGAENGGVIDRTFSPSDFGPQLGPQMAVLDTGQVTEPVREGGRFLFFKVLSKETQPTGQPGIRVAEFMVRIKADEDELRKQYDELNKLRAKAQRDGIGRAATSAALSTTKTPFFDMSSTPNELAAIPSAADWAFGAKVKDVSPVMETVDYFAIVQLLAAKDAGPMPRDAITDQLRQLTELEVAIDALKPKADAMAAALQAGQPLEQAAAAAGVTVQKIDGVTRTSMQSDPRLFGQPEIIGRLFAAQPGAVVGPVRGLSGFVAARVDSRTEPDWTAYEAAKGQFAQQMLETRQRQFIDRFAGDLRARASVKDLRSQTGY